MPDGKWIEGLSPSLPASEAAKLVFAARFAAVRACFEPALAAPGEDIEPVHQLRVATRRASAAVRVFRDCLKKSDRRKVKAALRAIRRAAGAARDWDIFLRHLRSEPKRRTAAGQPALDFLLGYAVGERSAAQDRLNAAAAECGEELLELCDSLQHKVRDAEGAFSDLSELFTAQLAAFTDLVRSDPQDPAALHQLRIQGKRLRYSLELFAPWFPTSFADRIYTALEAVQEILGDLHDAAMMQERLTAIRDFIQARNPMEWIRLKAGFTARLAHLKKQLKTSRERFQKWQADWQQSADQPAIAG